MRRSTGWEPDYFDVESYRVTSYHREGVVAPGDGRRAHQRGHGQDLDRRRAPHRGRRGQRPRQRARLRTAHCAQRALPLPDAHPSRRLPGAGARHRGGDRGGDPGPHRVLRRRRLLVHGRGVRERHRGELDGARRCHGVRSAPQDLTDGEGWRYDRRRWQRPSSSPPRPVPRSEPTNRLRDVPRRGGSTDRPTSPAASASRPATGSAARAPTRATPSSSPASSSRSSSSPTASTLATPSPASWRSASSGRLSSDGHRSSTTCASGRPCSASSTRHADPALVRAPSRAVRGGRPLPPLRRAPPHRRRRRRRRPAPDPGAGPGPLRGRLAGPALPLGHLTARLRPKSVLGEVSQRRGHLGPSVGDAVLGAGLDPAPCHLLDVDLGSECRSSRW